VVSIRNRALLAENAEDPWDGHTLEWSTASPPAPYNFARLPQITGRAAHLNAKRAGRAKGPAPAYRAIALPRNTAAGVIIGAMAFAFGFAMVWHIWWLAGVAAAAILAVVVLRVFDRRGPLVLTAERVAAMEAARAVTA
jgi:cytochrome o ubiquinol oxidase subunit 1